jgi:hypothetical protein
MGLAPLALVVLALVAPPPVHLHLAPAGVVFDAAAAPELGAHDDHGGNGGCPACLAGRAALAVAGSALTLGIAGAAGIFAIASSIVPRGAVLFHPASRGPPSCS